MLCATTSTVSTGDPSVCLKLDRKLPNAAPTVSSDGLSRGLPLPGTVQLSKKTVTSPFVSSTWSAFPKVLSNEVPMQTFWYPFRKTTGGRAVLGIGLPGGINCAQETAAINAKMEPSLD